MILGSKFCFFTKQPLNWPKQLLRVKSEKSSILLSNSTRNPKSGVAYKKKKVYLTSNKFELHRWGQSQDLEWTGGFQGVGDS